MERDYWSTFQALTGKKPWMHLADAFYSVGDRLRIACVNAEDQPELDGLYSNYAQVLYTIKANIEFLEHKVEQILDEEE
ncbi:MAG: hypothetical protein A2W25_12170 [candidate division Zixibacteria bacterium RBG_16_53_22]|nr:MAG: hypothetical protein A2W25_12170 [candidate division Zixibacteria bacterium RBG_16_53_22]